MKEFLSVHFPTAHSLASIARDAVLETREFAAIKISDVRQQVDQLWETAGEMLPRPDAARVVKRVSAAIEAMKNRDQIGFPMVREA